MPLWRISLLALAASAASAIASPPARFIKPVVVVTGIDSKEDKESFSCCRTRDDWVKVWAKHTGIADEHKCRPIEIDFESYMVLALFQGKHHSNRGIAVDPIADEPTQLRVRYRPLWYAKVPKSSGSTSTQSYAFVVVPRSNKAILIEGLAAGRRDIDVWVEKTRIPVLGK